MMNTLKNYKIIKELGHGMVGTVYLIKYYNDADNKSKINKTNTKKTDIYALKIEHVEKKDLKPNIKSEVWRELNFYKNLGNKYPDQFVDLVEYDFIKDCNHVQKYAFDTNLFDKQIQNKIKKKASSSYCIRKIFNLVDGVLTNLIIKLNKNQIYSMIIQLSYSIKLLHKSNYIHGDLHSGNVGWIKTNKKYINCCFDNGKKNESESESESKSKSKSRNNELKIKTFGYIYKLIDFGFVLNGSDKLNKREEKNFKEIINTELGNIKYFFVDDKFWIWLDKNKLEYNPDKIYNQIKKTKEFEIIKKFTSDVKDQLFLYDILFQQQYQKIICGEHFKKTIPRKLYIPVEDILFIVKLSKNPDLIIKYFYDKIYSEKIEN